MWSPQCGGVGCSREGLFAYLGEQASMADTPYSRLDKLVSGRFGTNLKSSGPLGPNPIMWLL